MSSVERSKREASQVHVAEGRGGKKVSLLNVYNIITRFNSCDFLVRQKLPLSVFQLKKTASQKPCPRSELREGLGSELRPV